MSNNDEQGSGFGALLVVVIVGMIAVAIAVHQRAAEYQERWQEAGESGLRERR